MLLNGDLGAGKTSLARGYIRCFIGNADSFITSPTYLLDNSYPDEGNSLLEDVTVHHIDLWRLDSSQSRQVADFDALYSNCVTLIEVSNAGWCFLSFPRLTIRFSPRKPESIMCLNCSGRTDLRRRICRNSTWTSSSNHTKMDVLLGSCQQGSGGSQRSSGSNRPRWTLQSILAVYSLQRQSWKGET